jgi:hypothetical protein
MPSDVGDQFESVVLKVAVGSQCPSRRVRVVRRWAVRRDSEITGSSKVIEQVTAVTVSILDWYHPWEHAPKPPSNGPPKLCHVQ